ncbi:MAG: DNA-3-methyladenine glycosylase [Terracidiphilus sp.]
MTESALLASLPGRAFFEASPAEVAPRLLGMLLVSRAGRDRRTQWLAGRIVEAEAYLGPHGQPPDPAAHSFRGPTPRNSVLFGPAGHAYVYTIYGRYFCMNVSCEVEGRAGCVLLRALAPIALDGSLARMARNRGLDPAVFEEAIPLPAKLAAELSSGPSRLCQALGLTRAKHNGLDLLDPASPLQLRVDGHLAGEVLVTPRIGINPANPALDWPLRFALAGHPCVSGPRRLRERPR